MKLVNHLYVPIFKLSRYVVRIITTFVFPFIHWKLQDKILRTFKLLSNLYTESLT